MTTCDHFWVLDNKWSGWRYVFPEEGASPPAVTVMGDPEDLPRAYYEIREYHCAKCRETVRDEA